MQDGEAAGGCARGRRLWITQSKLGVHLVTLHLRITCGQGCCVSAYGATPADAVTQLPRPLHVADTCASAGWLQHEKDHERRRHHQAVGLGWSGERASLLSPVVTGKGSRVSLISTAAVRHGEEREGFPCTPLCVTWLGRGEERQGSCGGRPDADFKDCTLICALLTPLPSVFICPQPAARLPQPMEGHRHDACL